MSLRSQLLAVFSALFVAVLTAILWVSVSGTRSYLEQQLGSHAQDAATALSVTLGQSLGKGDIVFAQAQVVSVFDRGYFKRIDVLGPNRVALVRREVPEQVDGVPLWFVRWFPLEAPPGEAFVGSGWRQLGKVLVISQPTFAYQHLWNTSVDLVAWLFAISAAALALVWGVLHFLLKPLYAIERSAMSVQAKRFEQIQQRPRAPELARVVTAMNQMSRSVGEMLAAETSKAQALHKQAYEDELTGLANRRGYELRLSELLLDEHQFASGAVVAVEIDDMRLLRRSHGYAAADHILRVVADTARGVFGHASGSLLARSNEFSFNFILLDMPQTQVVDLANQLHRSVLEQLQAYTPSHSVGINVGVAFFQRQEQRSDVFARADLAVESARQSGRNGFHVLQDVDGDNKSLGSMGWRGLIQAALVENRWRLLRQPVLQLNQAQTVLQFECMARLVDANGDLVPASHFMPMAARHQLMPDVDRAVVSLALNHLIDQKQEQALVVINLSPQSMASAEFMDWLAVKLGGLAARANHLAVEVSEFGALRNLQATLRLRDLMHSHGGKFGIDHFGLDPKALDLLRDVLPDYVKLTGSLTQEIEAVEAVSQMLESFVKLAHSLDVMVIAQQVERADQLAALAKAEVDGGQGYYLGAPQ
jgi:diguanylate cyclase (GGDEF)-like protein